MTACRMRRSGPITSDPVFTPLRDSRPIGSDGNPKPPIKVQRTEQPWMIGPPNRRRLWRLWQAPRTRPRSSTHHGSGVLEPCAPQVLRPGRHRGQRVAQGPGQNAGGPLADGVGSGPAYRRPVRDRAFPQSVRRPATQGRAPGTKRAPRRQPPCLDARGTRQALAPIMPAMACPSSSTD
jgi:hypothetical protein